MVEVCFVELFNKAFDPKILKKKVTSIKYLIYVF